PVRDGAFATICCGSSFIVRRSSLEKVGGFVTSTLCEDYFTGISLISSGYRVLYLDEALSAGLSPESMSAYIAQQQRWAAGTMQGFFIRENPLTVPGLTLLQRLHYAQGWLYWGSSLPRLLFLVVPVLTALLGLVPMKAGWLEWLLWFAPLYIANWATCNWLSYRSCSAVLSDIYAIVNCVPIVLTVVNTLARPFGRAFRVTPKGIARDRAVFNRMPGLPLLGIWGLTLAALVYALAHLLGGWSVPETQLTGLRLSVVWLAYNLLLVGMTVLACVDAPKPSFYEWFGLRRSGQFQGTDGDQPIDLALRLVSEAGAIVAWPSDRPLPTVGQTGQIQLVDRAFAEPLRFPVRVLTSGDRDPKTGERRVELAWQPLTLAQQRSLIEWIYCQPGQWQPRESPGELASFGLLLRCGLRPRLGTTDRRSTDAIALP
ncbi:MAG TPA: glycosyltransferase, partial [Coleofasciculaceae cyanobacterium]